MQDEPSLFIGQPPAFRIKEGIAHVIHGRGRVTHAMSVSDLQVGTERAQRALARHARGERDIIEDG